MAMYDLVAYSWTYTLPFPGQKHNAGADHQDIEMLGDCLIVAEYGLSPIPEWQSDQDVEGVQPNLDAVGGGANFFNVFM